MSNYNAMYCNALTSGRFLLDPGLTGFARFIPPLNGDILSSPFMGVCVNLLLKGFTCNMLVFL